MAFIQARNFTLCFGFEFEGVLEVKANRLEGLTTLGYKEFHRQMSRGQRLLCALRYLNSVLILIATRAVVLANILPIWRAMEWQSFIYQPPSMKDPPMSSQSEPAGSQLFPVQVFILIVPSYPVQPILI